MELPDDKMEVNAFQVLSMPRHMITIETFGSNQSLARRKWNVLPHSILHADILPAEPIEMNCFAVEDAVELDVVDILHADVEARRHIRVWETTESDFEGCLALSQSSLGSTVVGSKFQAGAVACIMGCA